MIDTNPYAVVYRVCAKSSRNGFFCSSQHWLGGGLRAEKLAMDLRFETKPEHCAIKFCVKLGKNESEIPEILLKAYGDGAKLDFGKVGSMRTTPLLSPLLL